MSIEVLYKYVLLTLTSYFKVLCILSEIAGVYGGGYFDIWVLTKTLFISSYLYPEKTKEPKSLVCEIMYLKVHL